MISTRFLPLLICFLTTALCYGQQNSRIVFFTMDTPVGENSSSAGESRVYTDALTKDGAIIAAMRPNTAFVYTTSEPQGSYALETAVSGRNYSNKLLLDKLEGSIAFVKISQSAIPPITAHLEMIDLLDFENYYHQAKWLRKRLKDEGFTSVSQLVKGFSIPPHESSSSILAKLAPKRNLKDTVFFDSHYRASDRESAVTFSITSEDSAGLFLIKDFYLPEGGIKSIYRYRTLDSESREGLFQDFYQSGRPNSRGNYKDNRKDGRWEVWYDTLPRRLWYTCFYNKDRKDGMLTSYYMSGKVKREELHQLFPDTQLVKNNGVAQISAGEKDSITSGRRYDASGREIPFTAFEIRPKPDFVLTNFLVKNLRYPDRARESGIQGRVIVQFTVDKSGAIQDAIIIRHADEDLDREALRVVNLMPRWIAGIMDDKPVNVYFTLPVTFKLD